MPFTVRLFAVQEFSLLPFQWTHLCRITQFRDFIIFLKLKQMLCVWGLLVSNLVWSVSEDFWNKKTARVQWDLYVHALDLQLNGQQVCTLSKHPLVLYKFYKMLYNINCFSFTQTLLVFFFLMPISIVLVQHDLKKQQWWIKSALVEEKQA